MGESERQYLEERLRMETALENYLKAAEDAIEGNDNNFDGIINNLPEDSISEQTYKKGKEYEEKRKIALEAEKSAKIHKPRYCEIDR